MHSHDTQFPSRKKLEKHLQRSIKVHKMMEFEIRTIICFEFQHLFTDKIKMSAYDWKSEMDRMLNIFEREAESSLREIGRSFQRTGRSFDKKFLKLLFGMSNAR